MEDDFLETLGIEKKEYGKKSGKYSPISSKRQMQTFSGKKRLLLDILIYGFANCPAPMLPDFEAYKFLKKKMSRPDTSTIGAQFAAQILLHYVKKFKSSDIKKYLDIGCGSCHITEFLAEKLKISPCGSDLAVPFEQSWTARSPKVKFETISDKKLLGHSGKWDLITAVMVLHHIPRVDQTIEEVSKSLNPGGLFIIKEHDCFSYWEDALVDIEHSLYIVQNNDKWEQKVLSQYIKCFNWIEWAYKMSRHGLQLVHYGPWGYMARSYGTTRKCIMVFKK